jgi:hypothetical protein
MTTKIDKMDRKEKIDALLEFFDENHVKLIDTTCIGSIIVDAEQTLDKVDDRYEYDELIEKGLTYSDIEALKKFLEKNNLMMIKEDDISGVSFEHSEYYIDGIEDTDLWKEEYKNAETAQVKVAEEEKIMEIIKKGIIKGYNIEDEVKTDNSRHIEFSGNGERYILNLLKLEE